MSLCGLITVAKAEDIVPFSRLYDLLPASHHLADYFAKMKKQEIELH
jgi:hypothetical protein